jgi:hypothetical protein
MTKNYNELEKKIEKKFAKKDTKKKKKMHVSGKGIFTLKKIIENKHASLPKRKNTKKK